MTKSTAPLNLIILGHVDHGKSTLIGRLLHETASLPDGKLEQVEASCKKRGQPFEWAFVTDALALERDQGITLDISHIRLRGKTRDTILIDAPGHKEFLQAMATGAASADAALIVIDAKEGVSAQTRQHAQILELLGMTRIGVVVTKMDAVGYKKTVFDKIAKSYTAFLHEKGMKPAFVIPVSARAGDNLKTLSAKMKWYRGKPLLAALNRLTPKILSTKQPLRFVVQDVYKSGEKRIVAGRVESGSLKKGDTLLFSPANTKAKIASIEAWPKKKQASAGAGESIGITLSPQIFIERGQVASHEKNPPKLTNLLPLKLCWLSKEPLVRGASLTVRIFTQRSEADIKQLAAPLSYGDMAEVTLRTRTPVAVDDKAHCVLEKDGRIVAAGVIHANELFDQRETFLPVKSQNISQADYGIDASSRAEANGHFGGIIWLTGLSSAGKSTIANRVQQQLFAGGRQVFVLDGDSIRHGLSRDLGFSPRERSENIRRVAEVAALFAQAGVIVITAFISPYREDRERARVVAPSNFHEVYVKASLKACEKRDPKGLYKKARAGKIPNFTGISAPYEEPAAPELVLDTDAAPIEACAKRLLSYIETQFILPAKTLGE